MSRPNQMNPTRWLAGTLELASKVRYGLTSRGVPLFRFLPYDRRFGPFAVGCSSRNLFYNVHAIVEPLPEEPPHGQLPRATLIQNLGIPTPESEATVLRYTFAFDSSKDLRKEPMTNDTLVCSFTERASPHGYTFHIDPPGCLDADDAFTIEPHSTEPNVWRIWIHIADVAAWIPDGSTTDKEAQRRATTFYTLEGFAEAPMLPRSVSEEKASLLARSPGPKPTISLSYTWSPDHGPSDFQFLRAKIECKRTYTYEEAKNEVSTTKELQILMEASGGSQDSHCWVQEMMILYNTKVAELLAHRGLGILRRHGESNSNSNSNSHESLFHKHPELKFLHMEAAEYCLPSDTYTRHSGLEKDVYAYASSPLRRYADLVNQRALHAILDGKEHSCVPVSQELIDQLNRREKQAKAYTRDLFFSTSLAHATDSLPATVLECLDKDLLMKLYVPSFKRIVKVRALGPENLFAPGTSVLVTWYEDRTKANWKERIVFRASEA